MLWRHPALRLLLLVLAFGVAGMHTLGHHEEHGESSASTPGHAVHAEAADTLGAVTVEAPTGELNPSQMCLAVLTAGALLALALIAARTRRRVPANRWRPRLRASTRSGRGPPGPIPVSLLAAQATVLRI